MVKETKKFGWERRVWSTCFAHFWSVPEGDVGCLLALTGQYKPPTGFCISLMRLPGNRRTGLLTCFTQSISFITQAHRRVSKVQRKMCLLGEQRTRAPSILTLSWRIRMRPQNEMSLLNHTKMPGFLASGGEEFNWGQRCGWIAQSFCVIKYY